MKKLVIWEVKGKVRPQGEARSSRKADEREILIAVDGSFAAQAVMAEAEGAMLFNWSSAPHEAEILSLRRTTTEVIVL